MKKVIKVNKDYYEFDEVVEEQIPTHDMLKVIFKKDGKVLKETIVDGMRWDRYRKYPSVIYNEIE